MTRTIRIIDLGLDQAFGLSTAFVEANVRAHLGGSPAQAAGFEVELIRTRSVRAIEAAVRSDGYLLHLLGHGQADAPSPGIWSTDNRTGLDFHDLAKDLTKDDAGLDYTLILADGCDTAKKAYVKALSACIWSPTVFVGSTKFVGWDDGSAFEGLLYSSLLLKPPATPKLALDRAQRAVQAYEALIGKCPFKVTMLQPTYLK